MRPSRGGVRERLCPPPRRQFCKTSASSTEIVRGLLWCSTRFPELMTPQLAAVKHIRFRRDEECL
jgi:hypothetical protein